MNIANSPSPAPTAKAQAVRCAKFGAKVGFWILVVIHTLLLVALIGMVVVASFKNGMTIWATLKKVHAKENLLLFPVLAVAHIVLTTIACGVVGGILGGLFGLLGRRKPPVDTGSPWDQEA